jgi:hypothetical protein
VAEWLLRLRGPDAWSTALVREPAIEILEKVHASPGILPRGVVLGTASLGEPRRGSEIVEEFGGPPSNAAGAQGFWMWEGSTS